MSDLLHNGRSTEMARKSAGEGSHPYGADILDEVRLAVVLYGGSSLAIYINGIVQELFKLVRATAIARDGDGLERPLIADGDLTSTERIYRTLGRLRNADRADWAAIARGEKADAPLGSRVVVDVLSGSSAGGINGVFLAKALIGDLSLDDLKRLWVHKGDITTLLYDGRSTRKPDVPGQKPVPSLLNGRRMYRLLLEALDGMERKDSRGLDRKGRTTRETVSKYVDELDLYVTATDLGGLDQWITLQNAQAYERRHRNVFRFGYARDPTVPPGEGRPDQNDFAAENNPFLAFAARCTSSLPFIFEPMELSDIEAHLREVAQYAGAFSDYLPDGPVGKEWRRFYADYLPDAFSTDRPSARQVPFPQRSFGDGGALDNSPFSYPIERLLRRQADRCLDRKLIYVEPDPAAPPTPGGPEEGKRGSVEGRPNALRNVLLQVVTLPRYQTIREDLKTVQDRNRLSIRTRQVLDDLRPVWRRDADATTTQSRWLDESLKTSAEGAEASERVYCGYLRLRAELTVQELALLVSRAAGLDDTSDELVAIRQLVRAWRDRRYATPSCPGDDPSGDDRDTASRDDGKPAARQVVAGQVAAPQSSEEQPAAGLVAAGEAAEVPLPEARPDRAKLAKEFLARFDTDYRFRLVKFLQSALDDAHPTFDPSDGGRPRPDPLEGDPAAIRPAVLKRRRDLNALFWHLRRTLRRIQAAPPPVGAGSPILEALAATKITGKELHGILRQPTFGLRRQRAIELVDERWNAFDALGDAIGRELKLPWDASADQTTNGTSVGEKLRAAVDGSGSSAEDVVVRNYLRFYEKNFATYDVVALPLVYGTDLGEVEEVDVIRMSPREATGLVDEKGLGQPKLGGSSFGHLGGFFHERWRRNDIMWGRLDAAECVINALVRHGDGHDEAVRALRWPAQRQILAEELSMADKEALLKMAAWSDSAGAGTWRGRQPGWDNLDWLMEAQARAFFETTYDLGQPESKDVLSNAGRGMHVTGKVLQGVAEEDGGGPEVTAAKALKNPTRWVALIGSTLTGMVEVAVAGPKHVVFRHLVSTLLLFEAVIAGFGIVLGRPAATQLGLNALLLTLLVVIAVWVVRIKVAGPPSKTRALKRLLWFVVILLVLALVGLAAAKVVDLRKDPSRSLSQAACGDGLLAEVAVDRAGQAPKGLEVETVLPAQVDEHLRLGRAPHPAVVGQLDVADRRPILVPALGGPQVHARSMAGTPASLKHFRPESCAHVS